MGANAREFLKIRMTHEEFMEIPDELRHGLDFTVEVEGVDYSHDELWCELKKKSTKAYKDLKKREFDLRHKIK
jgi:hypothetical protein